MNQLVGALFSDRRYGVVLGAWLTQFTVVGSLFTYGLLFTALETEFGWSRTVLSSSISIAFLVTGIAAIPGGRLSDRIGPGPVLGGCAVFFGVGLILLSQAWLPWHVIVCYGLFVGIGLSGHDVVTLSTIARWFERRRGIMTGFVKVGTATGQVVIPPVFAIMLASGGWRTATLVLGLVCLVILIFAAALMKAPPKRDPTQADAIASGMSYEAARRTRVFWSLCAIQFAFMPSLSTIPVHIAAYGADMGMATMNTAILLSVIGGTSIGGRVVVGTLIDWLGVKGAFALGMIGLFFGLIGLIFAVSPWMIFVATGIYGFSHGGLFTVSSPTIAAHFGIRAHGAIFGVVVFFGMLGGAIGPFLAGLSYDATDSYTLAFGTLAGMAVIGLGLVLSLPRPQAITQ